MGLMKHLIRRGSGGNFTAVLNVPAYARHLFGGRKMIWKSTGTPNELEAVKRAAPWIVEMKASFLAAKAGEVRSPIVDADSAAQAGDRKLDPEALYAALDRWRVVEIERLYREAFNGGLPELISQRSFDQMKFFEALEAGNPLPDVEDRLSKALAAQGVAVGEDCPRQVTKALRREFLRCLTEVERYHRDFIAGDVEQWRSVREESIRVSASSLTRAELSGPDPVRRREARSDPDLKLLALFSRWATSQGIPDVTRQKGYVTRLSEFLDNPDVRTITPVQMDDFKVALRSFPSTKRQIADVPFLEVITKFQEMRRSDSRAVKFLARRTQWKWFQTYNQMFGYAERLNLVADNPVAKIMSDLDRSPETEVLPYDAGDIAEIFSAPLFQGHLKTGGYRSIPGPNVQRDAKYWLPIFALWHGCRLEEIGGAKAGDVKSDGGIWFLDLRDRDLKNPQSRRLLPLHPEVIRLGFVQYAESQAPGWLFPELPHDDQLGAESEQTAASTRLYSKWWGRWCTSRAGSVGVGLDDPRKRFHSFRHAFKRACREALIEEEVHDLLTGHKGGNPTARAYGRGASIMFLAEQIAKVRYPSFPL